MSDLFKSISADFSEAAIKKVSAAFDPKKHYHGSWHYIYYLELILQGKRFTVDQVGNILIKKAVDFAVKKGGERLLKWVTQSMAPGAESSSSAVVPAARSTALQRTNSAGSSRIAGSGAATATSCLPAITCALAVVNLAGTVYNMYQLREVRKQNEKILGSVLRLEKITAEGFRDLNRRLDVEFVQVHRRFDNLEHSISTGVENINEFTRTKVDDAVKCLQEFITVSDFQTKLDSWSAQFETNRIIKPDPTSYNKLLVDAKQILKHSNSLAGQAKLSATQIYLITVIDLVKNSSQQFNNDEGPNLISSEILPIIGNLILSNIEKERTQQESIARESLMELSAMANYMQCLLYKIESVDFVEKATLKESVCWNVALHFARNKGVDLLVELFQMLGRASSPEDKQYLGLNIKLLGNFLDGPKDQRQIKEPQNSHFMLGKY